MTKEMQAFIDDNIEQIEGIKGYFIQLHGLTTTLKYAFQGECDVPLSFYGTADYLAVETEEAMDTVMSFQHELKTNPTPNGWEQLKELKTWGESVYKKAWDKIVGVEHIAEDLFIASIQYNIPEEASEDYDSLEIIKSHHIGTAKAINKIAGILKANLYDLLDGIKLYNEEEQEEEGERIFFVNGDEK